MLKYHFEYLTDDSAIFKMYFAYKQVINYFFLIKKKCPFDRLECKGTHQTTRSITVAHKTLKCGAK